MSTTQQEAPYRDIKPRAQQSQGKIPRWRSRPLIDPEEKPSMVYRGHSYFRNYQP